MLLKEWNINMLNENCITKDSWYNYISGMRLIVRISSTIFISIYSRKYAWLLNPSLIICINSVRFLELLLSTIN